MVGFAGDVDAAFLNKRLDLQGRRRLRFVNRNEGHNALVGRNPKIGAFLADLDFLSSTVFLVRHNPVGESRLEAVPPTLHRKEEGAGGS